MSKTIQVQRIWISLVDMLNLIQNAETGEQSCEDTLDRVKGELLNLLEEILDGRAWETVEREEREHNDPIS